jgi:hypothetical protein
MFRKFISKVLQVMNNEREESLKRQGSTMALEVIYMDTNNNLFKGRYLGTMVFMDVIRYKYEVDGGFILLDKPAVQYKGVKGVSNTALTYNNRSQVQKLNVSSGIVHI